MFDFSKVIDVYATGKDSSYLAATERTTKVVMRDLAQVDIVVITLRTDTTRVKVNPCDTK